MGSSAAGSPNALTMGPMPVGRPAVPAPTQTTAPPSGFNVNQAAASGLQQAMQGTRAAMGYQPMQVKATDYTAAQAASQGYDAARAAQQAALTADQVSAGQIAGTDLGAYTNPYESQVVQQSLSDLERSR